MKIPLVDLKAQYNSIKEEVDEAIHRVIEGGQFILGPDIETLEEEIAAYLGVRYAVGVASGTDALRLALLACGIGPEDKVITTPFTFIATAEAITQCGARPIFVDIDFKTFNIDPAKIEEKITEKTKAILPVHLYGQPVDMDPILKFAQKYSLKVVEDCAQALGAIYYSRQPVTSRHSSNLETQSPLHSNKNSELGTPDSGSPRKVGSLGDAGCLSFFPSKVLGAYGDGGMVVTNSPEIAEKVKMLRNHGCREKYYHTFPGFNSRLDSIQAALLCVKLRHLDEWLESRRQNAWLYSQLLSELEGIEPPYTAPYSYHIFNYYTVRLNSSKINRHKLRRWLNSQGIATAVYYPLSLHLQEVYKYLGHTVGDFPVSEQAQEEVISLPMYPELSEERIKEIAAEIKNFWLTEQSLRVPSG